MRRSVRHVAPASFAGLALAACAVSPPNRSTGAAAAESVTSQHPGRMTWAGLLPLWCSSALAVAVRCRRASLTAGKLERSRSP
jgi:hypothetical protein